MQKKSTNVLFHINRSVCNIRCQVRLLHWNLTVFKLKNKNQDEISQLKEASLLCALHCRRMVSIYSKIRKGCMLPVVTFWASCRRILSPVVRSHRSHRNIRDTTTVSGLQPQVRELYSNFTSALPVNSQNADNVSSIFSKQETNCVVMLHLSKAAANRIKMESIVNNAYPVPALNTYSIHSYDITFLVRILFSSAPLLPGERERAWIHRDAE